MKLKNIGRAVLPAIIILAALLILDDLKAPQNTFLWRSLFDAGHIPLFGVISMALLGLSFGLLGRPIKNPLIHYLIAFLLTGLLGLITEIIQYYTPRDADFMDIVRDGVGALSFLGVYLTFDCRLSGFKFLSSRLRKNIIRAAAVIVCLIFMIPAITWTGAFICRDNAFPRICTFESAWENKFRRVENAKLTITAAPAGWAKDNTGHVGRLTFRKSKYPSFTIEEPYPDWTGYDYFSFKIFSKNPQPINLELRVNDIHHNNSYGDRFNRTLTVNPGENRIAIPLDKVQSAPATRPMDMKNIDLIVLFAAQPKDSITVYLDDFVLK